MTAKRAAMRMGSVSPSTLAFVILAAFMVAISSLSLYGVYRAAREDERDRIAAYERLMLDSVRGRLSTAQGEADSIASEAASLPLPAIPGMVRAVWGHSAQYFEQVIVADSARRVIVGMPTASLQATSSLTDCIRAGQGWQRWPSWDPRRAVVVRKVQGRNPALWVVAVVRNEYITQVVDRLTLDDESLSTFVVDSTGVVVAAGKGSTPFRPSQAVYRTDGDGQGDVTVAGTVDGALEGRFARIDRAPGLHWSIMVLDSRDDAVASARRAMQPALLTTVLMLIAAVGLAYVYTARVVWPLRLMERRARDVASGGFARPVQVDRADEVGRMADAFNDMAVRLNSLQNMAQLLASATDLDELLDAVVDSVARILGTGDVAILLSDPDCRRLALARGRGVVVSPETFVVDLDEPSPITEAFIERTISSFRGPAVSWAAPVAQLFGEDAGHGGAAVPLVAGREVLGVIVAMAPQGRSMTESQIDTLSAFASNAAVAVQTSGLLAHERTSRREAEALRRIAELVARRGDLADTLRRAGDVACALFSMDRVLIAVEGRAGLGMPDAEAPDMTAALMEAWHTVSGDGHPQPDHGYPDPVLVADLSDAGRVSALLDAPTGCALFIPLTQATQLRGVLVLLRDVPLSAEAPEPTLRRLAGTVGRQLSLAIRNAYLLMQARARAINLETVFRISQAVSSELKLNVVLDRVLDVVQKILAADAVILMSYDSQTDRVTTTMSRGVVERDLAHFGVRPDEDLPGKVFSRRAPMLYGRLANEHTRLARIAVSEGLNSMMAVPLLARGRPIGVLAAYAREEEAFSGSDLELTLTFAIQAALAIDTAALYGKEHRVSSVLQASILPDRLPRLRGIEASSFYLPAGIEADIGGDYYDMFATVDGRIALAIGDVCGKGVVAATKTSMIKYSLRGLIAGGAGPGEALHELNRLVAVSADPAEIVTVWVGFLDLEAGTLVYANAGHPPGLLRHASSGRVSRLAPTGPLLGAVADAPFDQQTVAVARGDMLVLYTDGITEARAEGKFFGEGRVRRVVRKGLTAARTVDALLEALQAFRPAPLRDDAAALVVRLDGSSADIPV